MSRAKNKALKIGDIVFQPLGCLGHPGKIRSIGTIPVSGVKPETFMATVEWADIRCPAPPGLTPFHQGSTYTTTERLDRLFLFKPHLKELRAKHRKIIAEKKRLLAVVEAL